MLIKTFRKCSSVLKESLSKCEDGRISNESRMRTVGISGYRGAPNLSKLNFLNQDCIYLLKNWLLIYFSEVEAARNAICRNYIREFLEFNTFLSSGMIYLAILLGEELLSTLFKGLHELLDGLNILQKHAGQWKFQFLASAQFSAQLSPTLNAEESGSIMMLPETTHQISQRVIAGLQDYGSWGGRHGFNMMESIENL